MWGYVCGLCDVCILGVCCLCSVSVGGTIGCIRFFVWYVWMCGCVCGVFVGILGVCICVLCLWGVLLSVTRVFVW